MIFDVFLKIKTKCTGISSKQAYLGHWVD